MPLWLTFETDKGEEFFLGLEYVGDGDLSNKEGKGIATLEADVDVDAEVALAELGFELSQPVRRMFEWQKSPGDFLTSGPNLIAFLKALSAEGVWALGDISDDDVKNLFSFAAMAITEGNSDYFPPELIEDVEHFFIMLERFYPQHLADKKTGGQHAWPIEAIQRIGEMAVLFEDGGAADAAESLTREKVFKLKVSNEYCEYADENTFFRCIAEVDFFILEHLYDHWEVELTVSYRDAELTEWVLDEKCSKGGPDSDVSCFLKRVRHIPYGPEALLGDYMRQKEPSEPPYPDGTGDYAVFLNYQLLGRYEHEESARAFVNMSEATIIRENLRDMVGTYKCIRHKPMIDDEELGNVEDKDCADEGFDAENIDNWE